MPPLSTVVGGSLFAYGHDYADFTLETTHFAAQFSLGDTGSIPIPAIPFIGTSINCDAILAGGQTLRFGFVDWAGHAHQKLWFQGTLTFNAESLIHVPSLPATGPIHRSTPFNISGNLVAFPSDPFVDPPPKTFEYKLVGKGKLTVRLAEATGGVRRVTSYFYQFT
jgi:hypothetical protein